MTKAKVVIAGDAVVVTSSMKLQDLLTIAKYRPEALVLRGGEDNKEKLFCISANESGIGEINKYGATFGSESHDDEKLATITFGLYNPGEGDIKEQVADVIGSSIISLRALEETLPAVLEEIKSEKATVMDSITVAQ
jgi:hypothetical protein